MSVYNDKKHPLKRESKVRFKKNSRLKIPNNVPYKHGKLVKMKKKLLRCFSTCALLVIATFMKSVLLAQVKNATVKVNKTVAHQKITGFGGFVNSPQFGYNYMSEMEIRKMWGATSEAGYNIMRIYIPTGENNWAQVIPTAQLASSLGVKIFASPWSMPTQWKTYNIIGSAYTDEMGVKRTVHLKEEHYADYANYLNNFVVLLRNNGVELDAISIQNEPDYQVDYAGCFWTPAQITKFLKENRHLISCKVMAPETVGATDNYSNALNAADVLPKFDIYGAHQYSGIQPAFKNLQAQGKEAWMTEYLINWNANLTTGRDFSWTTDAFNFAGAVNDAMQANMNAWIHYATKRYYAMMGDGTFGTQTSEITKRGRILSHYAKYVTGSTRVQATWNDLSGTLYGTSYLSVTGDSVIVIVNNPSANAYNLAVDLPFLISSGRVIRTTVALNMADTVINFTQTNRPKVPINASSVTTLVFAKTGDLVPSLMTGELINYAKIDSLTPTNPAFGTAYRLSGKTVTFLNNMPLISTNQNANNGYLPLGGKFNRLVFRVESLSSSLNYTSANTTLYYINNADQVRSHNYGTVNFNLRNNFDWVIDISENVLLEGCKGVLSITNGNFSSALTMKFNNVFFAVGNERGYKFSGPYSNTDGNLLDCLDDTTFTSLDFRDVTGISSQTNWDSAAVNKNSVYYVSTADLTGKNNIVNAGVCNKLELRDMGGDFYSPLSFTANVAKFTATLNGYKMLVLPFQVSLPAGVNAYTVQYINARIEGTRITTGVIPANTPVLVNGTGTFEFAGSGNITPLANPPVGITNAVYIGIKVPLGSYYLSINNGTPSFIRTTSSVQPIIRSFDAYIALGAATTASSLQVVLDNLLPIQMGSFTARPHENKVRLDWNTYTEGNNDGFAIERSKDGTNFQKIGFVKGRGNSSSQSWYTFIDPLPLTGINYYRLKQIDVNGGSDYSSIKSVQFGISAPVVTLYPNPVSNILTIDGNGNKLSGTLIISDAIGRIVFQSNVGAFPIARLDVSRLLPGIYFYRLNNFKGTFSKQ